MSVEDPEDGRQLSSTSRTLVADRPDLVSGSIDLTIPPTAEPGLRSVAVDSARNASDDNATDLEVTGSRSTIFFVHEDAPVAGGAGPVWPQLGGDAQHSGRTLELGPSQVDLVRWTTRSVDDQPFHDPVVDEDGQITAVTWSGVVHRFASDGTQVWDPALRLGASVPFPPAMGPDGLVLVATGEGELRGIEPDRSQAWRMEPGGSGGELLSGATVSPDGTILVVHEPWTIAAISAGGERLSQRSLAEPSAYDPPTSSTPSPTPGPPVAVDRDGTIVAITEGGIAELTGSLETIEEMACNCTPRGVSLAPGSSIALVMGDREVVAVDRDTGEIAWRTGDADRPGSDLDGQIYTPPVVGWGSQGSQPVYVTDEGGSIHVITLGGAHIRSWRSVFGPIHGQAAVDADGHLYVADACREIRSVTSSLDPRWTKTLPASGCSGLPTGVVPVEGGGVLWAGPDGTLRMMGKDRPPEAQFSVSWEQERGYVFDARESHDPDGAPLTYTWRVDDGPVKRGSTIAHRFATSGNHTVHLTVDDGSSKVTTTRTMAINLPPQPRITDHGVEDGRLTLDANATIDPDDDQLAYWWHVEDIGGTPGTRLELGAESPRVYEVRLHVTDGDLNATAERTILAPTPDVWTNETLATFRGDCPAGICTVPDRLSFTHGALVELAVANGIGRTMTVEPALPVVPGGPDQVALGPRDQGKLYLRVDGDHRQALSLSPLGVDGEAHVPLTVRPAPGEMTWRVTDASDLQAGAGSTVELELEGTPPPADVSLRFSLESGARALAVEDVNLLAGESPNRTVGLTFTPEEVGTFTGRIVAESADPDRAQIRPAEGEEAERSFEVSEPGLLTMASRAASENPYITSGVGAILFLGLAGGGLAWYQRREDEAPTTRPAPDATTPASAAAGDDATVAQGFMPRKVDRFHVDRVLGEGGFGTTYLARDSVLERDVVLKDLENLGHGEARDLLLHEAKTAANLQHRNVVVVHDVIEEEGRLLLVMEYVEGGTLGDRIADGLTLKQAFPMATDVLEGLAALHEAGVVHRDLKPSNILVTPDTTAKITDFGVAVSLEEAPDQADAFVGTPRYMAPEQLAGDPAGPRADVYAAGALVYRMLTGDHHLGLGDATPPPEELLEREVRLPIEGAPDALNDVLARALARDPQDRYEDARAFAEALAKLDPGGSRAVEGMPGG